MSLDGDHLSEAGCIHFHVYSLGFHWYLFWQKSLILQSSKEIEIPTGVNYIIGVSVPKVNTKNRGILIWGRGVGVYRAVEDDYR